MCQLKVSFRMRLSVVRYNDTVGISHRRQSSPNLIWLRRSLLLSCTGSGLAMLAVLLSREAASLRAAALVPAAAPPAATGPLEGGGGGGGRLIFPIGGGGGGGGGGTPPCLETFIYQGACTSSNMKWQLVI